MNHRIEQEVRAEIETLHEFFVNWFAGTSPPDSLHELVRTRFDPGFVIVPPSGTLLTLEDLVDGLQAVHGKNPGFRIAIRNVRLRHASGDLVLATYEEWQRNAKASQPPDNARISTALLRKSKSLQWLHVHETWLPETVRSAGPFDF